MSKSELRRNRGTTQLPNNTSLVKKTQNEFELILTSDWHCGSNFCDYDGLREMIRFIKEDPRRRVIIGGDQMECAVPGEKDGGRDSDSEIDAQIIRTARALEPIKKQIDLIHGGNHGAPRTVSKAGMDPDLLLSGFLNVDYSVVPRVVQYVSSKGTVKVCSGHGTSAAANWRTQVLKLQAIYPGLDCYVLGHDHSLVAEQAGALVYDENGDEHWSPTWLCRSGSFLKYAGYARYAMLSPKPTGFLVCKVQNGQIKGVEARRT